MQSAGFELRIDGFLFDSLTIAHFHLRKRLSDLYDFLYFIYTIDISVLEVIMEVGSGQICKNQLQSFLVIYRSNQQLCYR